MARTATADEIKQFQSMDPNSLTDWQQQQAGVGGYAAPQSSSPFSDPYVSSDPYASGPDNTQYAFNPKYFASSDTANAIAKQLGGTVIQQDAILGAGGSPFTQSQQNNMVQLPNGRVINPAFIADAYTHGYPQSYIDKIIQREIQGGTEEHTGSDGTKYGTPLETPQHYDFGQPPAGTPPPGTSGITPGATATNGRITTSVYPSTTPSTTPAPGATPTTPGKTPGKKPQVIGGQGDADNGPPPGAPPPAANPADISSEMNKWVAANGMDPSNVTWDQWSYIYNAITGQQMPDAGNLQGVNRSGPIDLNSWMTKLGPGSQPTSANPQTPANNTAAPGFKGYNYPKVGSGASGHTWADLPYSDASGQYGSLGSQNTQLPEGFFSNYGAVDPKTGLPNGNVSLYDTTDPWGMSANDRMLAYQQGGRLDADERAMAQRQAGRGGDMAATGDSMSAWMLAHPGYAPEEQDAILGADRLGDLQLSDAQAASNFLTPQEQAAMKGDPGKARNYFSTGVQDNLRQIADDTGDHTRDTLLTRWGPDGQMLNYGADMRLDDTWRAQQDELGKSLDPAKLNLSGDYTQEGADILGGGAGAIRGAIDKKSLTQSGNYVNSANQAMNSGKFAVRGAIDPAQLNVSGSYMQDMRFGPEDQQLLVDQSARTAHNQSQAIEDQLQRSSAEAGTGSPLAMAAALDRARQTGALNAGDAMTNARLAAKELGLQATGQREATRLGAAQNLANLKTTNEQELNQRELAQLNTQEQSRLAAEQGYAGMASSAEQDIMAKALAQNSEQEKLRLDAEQYQSTGKQAAANSVAGNRMNASQFISGNQLANEQYLGNQKLQNEWDISKTGQALETGIDAAAAARAGQVAQNRQGTAQANQAQDAQRKEYADTATTQRQTAVANQRMNDLNTVRADVRQQQGNAEQNYNNSMAQRVSSFNATSGAAATAQGTAAKMAGTPGTAERIFGTSINAAAQAAKAGAGAKGAVVTKPTAMTVGEAGPEAVVPVGNAGGGGAAAPAGGGDKGGGFWSHLGAGLLSGVGNTFSGGILGDALSGMGNGIDKYLTQKDTLAQQENELALQSKLAPPAFKKGGQARGGMFNKPTAVTIGENGPEMVMPVKPKRLRYA